MSKFLILCRAEGSVLLASLMHRKKSNAVILALPFLFILLISVGYSFALRQVMSASGMIAYFLFVALLLTFLFSFTSIGGTLLDRRGFERLVHFPLSKRTIFSAKLTVFYCYLLLIDALFMLPCIVLCGANTGMVISSIVMTLFLPVVPCVVSGALSALFRKAAQKIRIGKVPQYIAGILGFILLMWFAIQFQLSLTGVVSSPAEMETMLLSIPLYSLFFGGVPNVLLAVLIQLALMAAFVFAIGHISLGGQSGSERHQQRTSCPPEAFFAHTPLIALVRKEASFYFSIPIYVFNTILSPVIFFIAGIALLLYPGFSAQLAEVLPGVESWQVFVLVACFSLGIGSTTNSSISLEGARLRQMKSFPVSAFQIMCAKILFNLLLLILFSLAVSIAVGLVLFGLRETLVLFFAVLSVSAFVSVSGLIINLKFPMLDYTNPVAVVKQSSAVMVSVLIDFAITGLIAGAIFGLRFTWLGLLLCFIGLLLLDAVLLIRLKKNAERLLAKL